MRLTTAPWAHQTYMAEQVTARARNLLLAGTGTGKTLSMLKVMADQDYRLNLVLTVRPAMRSVWEDEISEKTDGAADVLVLDTGTSATKAHALQQAYQRWLMGSLPLVVVVNYETARLLPLEDYPWHVVVADESHKLKSYNSKQSIDLAVKLRHVPHKVAMTGTGWNDRPTDVFGQVRWLEPQKYGRAWGTERFGTWTAFFERYVVYRTMNNIKIPTGYKNLDHLAGQLHDLFTYVDRDAVRQSTGVQFVRRSVRLSDRHMAAYRELQREMLLELGEGEMTVENQMVLALRLHQVTGGYYQPDGGLALKPLPDADAKIEALEDIADSLGDEPFVVFTRFTEDVTRVTSALRKLGIESRELSGRRDEHREWKRGEGQALIANIQAGSAGINLTRAAYAIYYSTGYSATDFTQSLGRLDRPGQERPVTIYTLVARDTIDETIYSILAGKSRTEQELLGALTNG